MQVKLSRHHKTSSVTSSQHQLRDVIISPAGPTSHQQFPGGTSQLARQAGDEGPNLPQVEVGVMTQRPTVLADKINTTVNTVVNILPSLSS